MQTALRVRTTVLPGGRIEVSDPHLAFAAAVEVIVLLPEGDVAQCRSAEDILAEAEG
jgi:hypothetical protein